MAFAPDKAWERLKAELKQAAPLLGIDKIGFTTADPFLTMKERLLEQRRLQYESGFEEPDIDKRVYPELNMEEPRSIISIAVAYPSKMPNPPKSEPGAYRGILSRSAWGKDYHIVLRDRLQKVEDWLRERVPDVRVMSMVDTGALVDRAVAERAGIGWSGKNCSIITPEFGSWVYLGEMITNIPFPPDEPVTEGCGDCNACIEACPTGALVGPGQLNAKRCISYVTQTKGFVSDELKKKIGNRLYGCDTCQVVCPKNRKLNFTHHPELQPDPELVKPLLKPLLTMSNREYQEKYGENASSWRGKKPIQRNAIIALGNFRDESAFPLLADLLMNDPRPVIRATAAWALMQINKDDAAKMLRQAKDRERDAEVLGELDRLLADADIENR
jgi:epoxyqueuosine reductase